MHVDGYVDGALELVTVVEQMGGVLSEEALSPLTKPEYRGVTAAGVDPYVIV